MREDAGAVGARRLLELLVERSGRVDGGHVDPRHDVLEHEVVEGRLARHVVVGGHRVHAELRAEPAHRERVEPLGVDDAHRRLDDALARERLGVLLAWCHRWLPVRYATL